MLLEPHVGMLTDTSAAQPGALACLQVVNGPKAELANIKSSAITTGNSAKQQIQDGIAGVNSTVGNMQSMLVGQLSNVKAKYEPAAHQYDGYRYSASMALYGVSILFVGLLLMSGYLNYHFGANFSVFSLCKSQGAGH